MASTLLAQLSPPANNSIILYTVPTDSAYVLCDLNITTNNPNTGIVFSLYLGTQPTIQPQYCVQNVLSPLVDSNNNILTNYTLKNIMVGQNENIFFQTNLNNLNIRLTGYSVPYLNQPLNIT